MCMYVYVYHACVCVWGGGFVRPSSPFRSVITVNARPRLLAIKVAVRVVHCTCIEPVTGALCCAVL